MSEKDESTTIAPVVDTQEIKAFDLDAWISTRKEFIDKVGAIMVEGKDYHVIQGKKSLAKGGAEKIASIFGWTASFNKDDDTLAMLEGGQGSVVYLCNLQKGSQFVGQGRGAADLAKNNKDANKTIKMAQKSAFIDAVIRSSGLSDIYSQDLEDMDPRDLATGFGNGSQPQNKPAKATTSAPKPISAAQIKLINKLESQLWIDITPDEVLKKYNTTQASLKIDDLLAKVKEQEAGNVQ